MTLLSGCILGTRQAVMLQAKQVELSSASLPKSSIAVLQISWFATVR